MPRGKQPRGLCQLCGHETTRAAMARHLESCPRRTALIAQSTHPPETLLHLHVQEAWRGAFWLDLEVRGSATLKDIDTYLRAIWLECCGHLSRFSLGERSGAELGMGRRVGAAFAPGVSLMHIYDFGTSSETRLTCVGQRAGAPLSPHPIALLTRNIMPAEACVECGRPATHVCMACLFEESEWACRCAEHSASHNHDDYGDPLELINSPRLGMCGYTGPAEPPY